MTASRRTVIAAAAALALPSLVSAAPKKPKPPKPCAARVAYGGPPLRALLGAWQFDAAARAGSSRLAPVTSDRLEAAFEQAAAKMQTKALTAALATADGSIWTQTLAGKPGEPLPSRFFWASVGKAYTATAILQMVEEGKLSLDSTLDRWAPEARNAAWITVEDLLGHTGGLYSFQNDPALRAEPGYKPPERLLAAAAAQPANFCPGAAWSYSNTGYVHLGRIIEAVDGKPYHEAMRVRIVHRLDLRETDILAPRQVVTGMAPLAPSEPPGGTDDDVTTPYAAGAVAASAGDAVKFWRAMMSDRLHGAEQTRRRFMRLYPMTGVGPAHYGLGVMVSDLAAGDPRATDTWLGHAGGLPGAKAVIAYSLETQAYVAVALTGEGSPEATANLLLSTLPKKA
ncbi:beta-lactamase family protein [Phenylobacterium sp. LH3H17]|uniref:serine hydrolase domain-containing protein n=1 Tax=Phenylobacterium sp. LH3H17 TaxID=2903901 RepID=UPI0020C9FB12|nr:serine hydrolase domain-containing protein [Phenylobacterium sp. LH3H17]UTP40246.1 beta-lactamase family protein [Phenylobacterium sp. LH3H17]